VPRIAPSILSADFAALARAIDDVAAEADMLHVDVMDGHFVPNLTIGPPVVRSIRRHTDLYLDCHLMVTDPANFLEEVGGVPDLIRQMRDLGLDAGLAVNPETPFEACEPYLADLDLLLMMTVHPGFAGQHFIDDVMPKVRQARDETDRRGLGLAIQVDGGIDERTAPVAAAAGADTFVAGTAIFGADDPAAAAGRLRAAVS